MNALLSMTTLLLSVGTAVGQQIWKVSCLGGPGIDFTDLPPAVAAAAPGDTIWVFSTPAGCPSSQPFYTAPTIDKPLNILGFNIFSTPPPPGSFPTNAGLLGVLTITGIAAGDRVVISSISTGPLASLAPPSLSGLHVSDCSGEVVLEDFGHGALGQINESMEIHNCANVTFHGGEIAYGGASLNIVNSTVRMSSFYISSVQPWIVNGYTMTTPAVTLTNSTLTVTNSLLEGGDEYLFVGGFRPAVIMTNSTMYLGPGANLIGGRNMGTHFPTTAYTSQGTAPNYVYRDPRTVVAIPGNPGNVVTIPQDIPATYNDFAVANDFTTVTFAGPSDGFALLLLGDLPLQPTPTPFGSLLIDPSTVDLIDIVALPGGSLMGFTTKDYFVPAAALNAHPYALQALTLSPTGALGLTLATPFCVGWEHGRLP